MTKTMNQENTIQQINRMLVTNFNSTRLDEGTTRKINFQPEFQSQMDGMDGFESTQFEKLTAKKNQKHSQKDDQMFQDFGETSELQSYKVGFSGS